jgi:hypothetical protein
MKEGGWNGAEMRGGKVGQVGRDGEHISPFRPAPAEASAR